MLVPIDRIISTVYWYSTHPNHPSLPLQSSSWLVLNPTIFFSYAISPFFQWHPNICLIIVISYLTLPHAPLSLQCNQKQITLISAPHSNYIGSVWICASNYIVIVIALHCFVHNKNGQYNRISHNPISVYCIARYWAIIYRALIETELNKYLDNSSFSASTLSVFLVLKPTALVLVLPSKALALNLS